MVKNMDSVAIPSTFKSQFCPGFCVTWGKLLNLSVLHFSYLYDGAAIVST